MRACYFLSLVCFLMDCRSEELDPFSSTRTPKSILAVSWSHLHYQFQACDNEVIVIPGWIESEGGKLFLYRDKESREYGKAYEKILLVNDEEFESLLKKSGLCLDSIKNKMIYITSRYSKKDFNDLEVVGFFSGPLIVQIMSGRKEEKRLFNSKGDWKKPQLQKGQ